MWFKKLKKKKLQCFLIGLLLLISSLIFTTSLSLVTSINGYVKSYYSNEKFYDIIVYDANPGTKEDVYTWGKNNYKVKDVKSLDAFNSGNNLYHKDKKIKIPDYDIIALENYNNIPFGITKVKSLNKEICPLYNEIWISKLFADAHNISLGDNIKFKLENKDVSLKVSALINDSLQPSHLMSKTMLYINKNNEKDFNSLKKVNFTFVKPSKNADIESLSKALNKAVDLGGYTGNKDIQIQAATMVTSIIGAIASLSSLMIFFVSVFLIRFLLWNNILKEYKSIGIYKSLGFTKKEIQKIYITGYSLTSLIGCILGTLFSIPLLNYIASKVIKYIGAFRGIEINFSSIIITVLLFSSIVFINLYLVIRRTNKISPVDALRTGVTSSKKKLTRSLIKNSSSPLTLAVNDIFKYKKISVYILLSLTISISLIIFFGNTNYSTQNMKYNSNDWFGTPKGDVYVSLNGVNSQSDFKNILDDISKDKRVKNYTFGSVVANNVKLDTKKYHINTSLYGIMSMSSYTKDQGLNSIEGENPKRENEVSVTVKILKDANLHVGDYIELTINNEKNTYLITGSYNTLGNNGYQIRMLNSEIEKYMPHYIYNEIFINLKNASDAVSFENHINKTFSFAGANSMEPNNKDMIETLPDTINPITLMLIIAFVVFSIIIVFNIIIMNLMDNKKNFGIMKSLGFTSKEIRKRYLYKFKYLFLIIT